MNTLLKIVCAVCLIGIGYFGKLTYNNLNKEEKPSLCTTEGQLAEDIWNALHKGTKDGMVSHKEGSVIHVHCHGSRHGTILVNGNWMQREDLYFYIQDQIDSDTRKIVLHCCFPGTVAPIYMMGVTIQGDSNVKTETWNRLYEIDGKSILVHTAE